MYIDFEYQFIGDEYVFTWAIGDESLFQIPIGIYLISECILILNTNYCKP
jgi:hypothetical protein